MTTEPDEDDIPIRLSTALYCCGLANKAVPAAVAMKDQMDPPIFDAIVQHSANKTLTSYLLSREFLEWAITHNHVPDNIWYLVMQEYRATQDKNRIIPRMRLLRDLGIPPGGNTDDDLYRPMIELFYPEGIAYVFHEVGVPFQDEANILIAALLHERCDRDVPSDDIRDLFPEVEFLRNTCGLAPTTMPEWMPRPMRAERIQYLHDVCGLPIPSAWWECVGDIASYYNAPLCDAQTPLEMARLFVRLGCPIPEIDERNRILSWILANMEMLMGPHPFYLGAIHGLFEAGFSVPDDMEARFAQAVQVE